MYHAFLLMRQGGPYREGLARMRGQLQQLAGNEVLVQPELVLVSACSMHSGVMEGMKEYQWVGQWMAWHEHHLWVSGIWVGKEALYLWKSSSMAP